MDRSADIPAAAPARYRLPLEQRVAVDAAAESQPADPVLYRQNASWFCRLRWWVVGLLSAAGLLGWLPGGAGTLGVRLDGFWPWLAAAFLAVLNVAYLAWMRRNNDNIPAGRHDLPTSSGAGVAASLGLIRRHLRLQILVDLIVLTAVIHCVGSTQPAAPFAYLFHIVLSCIFFTRWESLVVALAAAGLYLGLLGLEAQGLLSMPAIMAVGSSPAVDVLRTRAFWVTQVLPMLAVGGVIWYLASRLSGRLRHREAELAAANRRLVAGIDERTRHMLQTTHQLKAPFAAIHANTQLLLSGVCGPLAEPAREVMERISIRAASLSQQIVEMLQLANLRSAAQAPPAATAVDLGELTAAVVARLQPAAALRDITIQARTAPSPIAAAEDHMRMLVENLLTNAVNYSYDGGEVDVICAPHSGSCVRLEVADHGIGIPAEKLPHIFEDYFRTREAARHNKTSTGLGLAIVRDLARLWRIDVEVESAVGAGTRFTLTVPQANT